MNDKERAEFLRSGKYAGKFEFEALPDGHINLTKIYGARNVFIPDETDCMNNTEIVDPEKIEEIFIPSSVISIWADYSVGFSECLNLKRIWCFGTLRDWIITDRFDIGWKNYELSTREKGNDLTVTVVRFPSLDKEDEFIRDVAVTETFSGCTSIKKCIFPKRLKKLGYEMFNECTNLEEVILPTHLEEIGDACFWCCVSLKEIKLPRTLRLIEANAFCGCDNLHKVYFGGSKEEWDAIEIEENNDPLEEAEIIFNYSGE